MKCLKISLFFFTFLLANTLSSQTILEGVVKDKDSKETLSFATVQYASGKGVITNEQGYFRIPITAKVKELKITYIGYQALEIVIDEDEEFIEVLMSQVAIPLETITVYAKGTYAYDLFFKSIVKSRRDAGYRQTAKAFRRTYSYRDEMPSEHMEAFYNAKTRDGGLDYLDLKNGRYGVPSDTSFINMQMTSILEAHKLFSAASSKFPGSPLECLSIKKLKNDYGVRINNIFAVEQDTILEFSFHPLHDQSAKFSGKAWVRNSNLIIEKVELGIKNTTENPFIIPIYTSMIIQQGLSFLSFQIL